MRTALGLPSSFVDNSIANMRERCQRLFASQGRHFEEGGRSRFYQYERNVLACFIRRCYPIAFLCSGDGASKATLGQCLFVSAGLFLDSTLGVGSAFVAHLLVTAYRQRTNCQCERQRVVNVVSARFIFG